MGPQPMMQVNGTSGAYVYFNSQISAIPKILSL
jgi:hypothetical protein